MHHTFYAVFDRQVDAATAMAEIEHLENERNHRSVALYRRGLATGSGTKSPPPGDYATTVLHRDLVSGGELLEGESAIRRGAIAGAVAGAVLGGLAGLIVGPLAGAIGLPVLLGALLGFVYGGVMGGIAAANGPDPVAEKLARHLQGGQVLLSVEAPGLDAENADEEIVRRYGGRVEHRSLA
jgi:hypothetical protein